MLEIVLNRSLRFPLPAHTRAGVDTDLLACWCLASEGLNGDSVALPLEPLIAAFPVGMGVSRQFDKTSINCPTLTSGGCMGPGRRPP